MTQAPGQPGPYGPWNAPVQQLPPPPPKQGMSTGRKLLFAVAALVVAVGVIVASAFTFTRLNAPAPTLPTAIVVTPTSSAPSLGSGFTIDGTTLKGATFTATLPAGYQLSEANGVDNDGSIFNDHDAILYYAATPNTASSRCTTALRSYQQRFGGTISDAPTVMWAGTQTVTMKLNAVSPTTGVAITMYSYCVDRPGTKAAAIQALTDAQSKTDVTKTVEALLASWTWT